MLRVMLPFHLRTLASVTGEITLSPAHPVTIASALDALESRYPMLKGTIRDHATRLRRPFIRFFAAGLDLSHHPPDTPLPPSVLAGSEPFHVIGAIAGG